MWFRIWKFNWLSVFFPNVYWQGANKNAIYLTFDDGPNPIVTPQVLDLLEEYKVHATFFCVGENIEKHPELYSRIIASGHLIGNHTHNHDNGWRTKANTYINSVERTHAITNSRFFRPPYGKINLKSINKIKALGNKIVFWSWLSRDYDSTISNAQILKASLKIKGGDILVFHDNEKTKDRIIPLLKNIVPALLSKNLTFRTLENL